MEGWFVLHGGIVVMFKTIRHLAWVASLAGKAI
jgi:hypothetical protein